MNLQSKMCDYCGNKDNPLQAKYCLNCGTSFQEISEDAVLRFGDRCPRCGSRHINQSGTKKPRRFYNCENCGEKWRSIEVLMYVKNYLSEAKKLIEVFQFK